MSRYMDKSIGHGDLMSIVDTRAREHFNKAIEIEPSWKCGLIRRIRSRLRRSKRRISKIL